MWDEFVKAISGLGIISIVCAAVSFVFTKFWERKSLEHEIRVRRVDAKVAATLSKLYDRLFRLYRAVDGLMMECRPTNERPSDESLTAVRKARDAFYDTLFSRRLYIPESLFEKTKCLGNKLDAKACELRMSADTPIELGPARHDAFKKSFESIRGEVDPLFLEINAEFKKRIGMSA